MTKKGQKAKFEKEIVEKDSSNDVTKNADADDEEMNSGFGSYLRSTAGGLE